MRSKVRRWGNYLAIRIPKALAVEAGLVDKATVEVRATRGILAIVLVREGTPTLKQLLSRVTAENLHDEADLGVPEGREAW